MLLLIKTDFCLPVMRSWLFPNRCWEIIVSNAELKSMNSIRTLVAIKNAEQVAPEWQGGNINHGSKPIPGSVSTCKQMELIALSKFVTPLPVVS